MDASAQNQAKEGFSSYHLRDVTFTGPCGHKRPPYASLAILDPIITVERHFGKYHIAARFNIETAILDYASNRKDGRELFFHDICLQYKSPWDNENLSMKPESDPAAALTVTRGFTSSTSATAGVTASQTPSGNVSLGLTQARSLTVEYAMTSWSLSAHRVVSDDLPGSDDPARYQWFWAGTQDESRRLSSDLRHAVKRHVVVKRIVPEAMIFPFIEKHKEAVGDKAKLAPESSRDEEEAEGSDDGGEDGGSDSQEGTEPNGTQSEGHTSGPADTSSSNLLSSQDDPKTEPKYTWQSLLEFNFSVQYENKLDELPEKDFIELAAAHIRREGLKLHTGKRDDSPTRNTKPGRTPEIQSG
ncbi:hypothetical protein FMUND_476 [Fusarium mundagurra]|uniref:Uncharacterized protein n=1 Tax=Fusarium mundagurra TaxID=1567541 RepID=A0A8H6DPS1_9HYPO|nr:hypothetical protein FMUND_476 [Fusarium mundagurra]